MRGCSTAATPDKQQGSVGVSSGGPAEPALAPRGAERLFPQRQLWGRAEETCGRRGPAEEVRLDLADRSGAELDVAVARAIPRPLQHAAAEPRGDVVGDDRGRRLREDA